jgi:hypothetical protein
MIAGIDPGIKGAVGLLYPDGTAYVYDMPVFSKEVNAAALASIFRDYETLALNMAELKRFIQQQKQLIVYYEKAVKPKNKTGKK